MRFCLLVSLILGAGSAFAFDHTYAKWDRFLKTYVVIVNGGNASKMKYSEAKKNRADLDSYIQDVEAVKKPEYDSWTDPQKQAFLINSYNALTVKLILDNNIPKSIKDTGSLLKSPWKKKFFKLFAEESYLDHIEHDLARGTYTNCRFHFAFNCASIGCPMLRNEAWLPEKLTAQFEDSAKRFLSDTSRNVYDDKSNSLQISKIFDWYGKDFEKDKTCGGSVKAFVSRYIKDGAKPIPDSANVKFLDYDWKLNGS